MAEGVVDGLQVVEVDDQDRPGARLAKGQPLQGDVQTRPVRQVGEGIDIGAVLSLDDPPVTLKRDGAQGGTRGDNLLLARGGGVNRPAIGTLDRRAKGTPF
ncbi:hypothetical protein ASE05_30115 [Mesorhizobium sp. Root172]|jgi:hypothetical protein|nr:hypothetical protein ASE05_30115 [Mesorhizobium sp. Root172]